METLKEIRIRIYRENKRNYFNEIAELLKPSGFDLVKINVSSHPDRFEIHQDSHPGTPATHIKEYEADTDYLRLKYREVFIDILFSTNGWQMECRLPGSSYSSFSYGAKSIEKFIRVVEVNYETIKSKYTAWYAERGNRLASQLGIM